MRNLPYDDFSDWYVLQVMKDREAIIKKKLERILQNNIHLMLFTKELIHNKKGNNIKILYPLFPGYLFVNKYIREVCFAAKNHMKNEFIKSVGFSGSPSKVLSEEMFMLLNNSDENGIFRLSSVVQKNDDIRIINGPLKNINGKIEFINKKKKKAKVIVKLFNKEVSISLGLDFIEAKENRVC